MDKIYLQGKEILTPQTGVKSVNGQTGDVTVNTGISEAPSDGKQYARKDGEWSEIEDGEEIEPLTFVCQATGSSFKFEQVGTPSLYTGETFYYSKNGDSWTPYTLGTAITGLYQGNTISIKGTNDIKSLGESESIYKHFKLTGSFDVFGDVRSLLGTNAKKPLKDYAFCKLFYCSASTDKTVLSAPKLPSMELGKYCYTYMFYNCTGLTIAPELPATTLAEGCYKDMFYRTSSLSIAPYLPAEIPANYCYFDMFAYSGIKYAEIGMLKQSGSRPFDYMFDSLQSSNGILCFHTSSVNISVRSGWTKVVNDYSASVKYVDNSVSSKISDAPSDDKQYARKNGAWAEVACLKKVTLTQEEYDALTTKDGNTLYVIIESNVPDFTQNIENGIVPDNHKFAIKVSDTSSWCFYISGVDGSEGDCSFDNGNLVTSVTNGDWENVPLHIIKTTSEYYVIEAYSEGYGASLYDSNGEYTKFWKVND